MSINNILLCEKYKNEILFFIINFDSQLVDVAINMPSHAFRLFTRFLKWNLIRPLI